MPQSLVRGGSKGCNCYRNGVTTNVSGDRGFFAKLPALQIECSEGVSSIVRLMGCALRREFWMLPRPVLWHPAQLSQWGHLAGPAHIPISHFSASRVLPSCRLRSECPRDSAVIVPVKENVTQSNLIGPRRI